MARARALDERQTALKARQQDREARLAQEMARQITDKSLEELEPRFREGEEVLKALRDRIAALRHQLSEHAAAKERIREKQAAIEAQKKECLRWKNLHELIGSADGKKYRNFAQGLTFAIMVRHANRQLRKMSEHYPMDLLRTRVSFLFTATSRTACWQSLKMGSMIFCSSLASSIRFAWTI